MSNSVLIYFLIYELFKSILVSKHLESFLSFFKSLLEVHVVKEHTVHNSRTIAPPNPDFQYVRDGAYDVPRNTIRFLNSSR